MFATRFTLLNRFLGFEELRVSLPVSQTLKSTSQLNFCSQPRHDARAAKVAGIQNNGPDHNVVESVESRLSLEESQEQALNRIRDAAKGLKATFCCGGRATCKHDLRIYFSQEDRSSDDSKAAVLHLSKTGQQANLLSELIQASTPATFGKGSEDVLDLSYRKALKLEPERFSCSLDLAELGVLEEVKTLMAAQGGSIRAELYKLNIHQQGGFFKAHVDTPRGEGMFASLVVVLPTLHTGGAVQVEHNGMRHTFGTSLNRLPAAPRDVQWMAFYSDCIHEVEEVTSGARLSLTYNLFLTPPRDAPLTAIQPESLAMYEVLRNVLRNPQFLPHGGNLAFGCQHAYAHNSYGDSLGSLEGRLKGADASLFAVAGALGLNAKILPVETTDLDEPKEYRRLRYSEDFGTYCFDTSEPEDWDRWEGDQTNLVWCHDLVHEEVSEVKLVYGNEHNLETYYNYAVIVLRVPPYNKRWKRALAASPTPGHIPRYQYALPEES